MNIVMNMSSYVIERELSSVEDAEDAQKSGWNPALEVACRSVAENPLNRHIAFPPSLANVEVEHFLRAMYAAQR